MLQIPYNYSITEYMEKIGRDVPNKQHIEPMEIWRSNDQKMVVRLKKVTETRSQNGLDKHDLISADQ